MRGLTRLLVLCVAALMGAAGLLTGGLPLAGAETSTPSPIAARAAPEPYGGCKEAWQAPRSPGAKRCRELGYAVSAQFVLSPRGVVLHSSLPHCAHEDGSGGPRPCTWNVGPGIDGNGIGLAYKVRRDMSVRYLWASSPAVHRWTWVSERKAGQLARRFTGQGESRSVAAWQRCVIHHGHATRVRCPDGNRYRLDPS